MRINSITTGHNARSQQLRIIYGSYNPIVEAAAQYTTPLSYIFIESVYNAHILEQGDLLPTLLQAGLSKLRTALTADSTEDLVMLLRFMGANVNTDTIRPILDQASSSQTDLLDNEQWWESLFDATQISDDNIRSTIRNQVAQIAKSPQLPVGKPQPDPQSSTDPPLSGSYQQTMQSAKQSEQSSQPPQSNIQQHRQEEQQYNDYLSQQLEQIRAGRAANRAEIEKLLKAIEDKKRQAQTESICNDIALRLLAEHSVYNNIASISHLMARRISTDMRVPYQHITEANVINRFSRAFRDLSNVAANPGLLGAQGVRSTGLRADNQRVGKLAIQFIANHLRDIFDQRLQAADMTPDDIIADYQKFAALKQKRSRGTQLKPAEVQQYNTLVTKLKQVRKLFDRTTPSVASTATNPVQSTDTAPQDDKTTEAVTAEPVGPDQPADSTSPASTVTPDSLEVAGPSGVEDTTLTDDQIAQRWKLKQAEQLAQLAQQYNWKQAEQLEQEWSQLSPAQRGASSKLNDKQKQDAVMLLTNIKYGINEGLPDKLNEVAGLGDDEDTNIVKFKEDYKNPRLRLDILGNPAAYNQYVDRQLSQWLQSNKPIIIHRLAMWAKEIADQKSYHESKTDNDVASAVNHYLLQTKVRPVPASFITPQILAIDDRFRTNYSPSPGEFAATRLYSLVAKLVDKYMPNYIAGVKKDILERMTKHANELRDERNWISRLLGRNR